MKQFKAFRKGKPLAVAMCMLAAGLCYSCGGNHSEKELVMELEESKVLTSEIGTEDEAFPAEDTVSIEIREPTEETLICVHVCGCVNEPGVYKLPAGSRIYEAVEAAGGFTQDGSRDFLNMAQELTDAMKVEVPSVSEVKQWEEAGILTQEAAGVLSGGGGRTDSAKTTAGTTSTHLVNLNTASREELMTLKGIGESRAEDIIHYRENFGGFQSIRDIMNVPGIKEGAFEKIKDSITV